MHVERESPTESREFRAEPAWHYLPEAYQLASCFTLLGRTLYYQIYHQSRSLEYRGKLVVGKIPFTTSS